MAALASADINHQILASVANFKTLLSLISTSKAFNAIFEAHPQSIIRNVAYREVGAALPQALRLVRCEAAHLHCVDVADLPDEGHVMTKPIERGEARMLAKNARIAHTFEDLFSWRCKDRTSRTSQLTNDESLSFQRALYRLWLYSAVYGTRQDNDEDDDDDDGLDEEVDEGDATATETVQARRHSFLDSFTSSHLDDMEKVYGFLTNTATWVIYTNWRERDFIGFGDWVLHSGPRAVLAMYESITPDLHSWGWQDGGDEGFFSSTLDLIRQERSQGSQQSNSSNGTVILVQVIGENDKCQRCYARKGLELWNETNWDYLLGILDADISRYLPGRLRSNFTEMEPLRDTLRDIQYSAFLRRLFSEKEAPFDTLTEQDWLCLDCLGQFIGHHVCRWWLDHKREAGMVIPEEDCWYGYNCRTMTHNPMHAGKLNHICVPTRGDP